MIGSSNLRDSAVWKLLSREFSLTLETYSLEFTYRLSQVPAGDEFLLRLQGEEGVLGHVVHLVVHNAVRLGVKALDAKNQARD